MNADPNETVVEEPQVDPAGESEVQPEPEAETPPEPVEAAPESQEPWFASVTKLVDNAFSAEVDPKAYGEMLAKMTPDDIAAMPPGAVAAMRAVVEWSKHGRSEIERKEAALAERAKKERTEIEAERARVARDGAALNALLTSPEIRRLRETKVPEKPDLTTPEGQKAYFESLVGKRINETFSPLLTRAETISQQQAWADLNTRIPELKDKRALPELGGKTFLSVVEAELEAREKAGRPIDTETASHIVRGRVAEARIAQQRIADREARARAAQNIQRATGGRPAAPKVIPPEVVRSGKIAQWLRENPDYSVS